MKLMQKTVWAITPEMLSTMVSIAHQTNKSPEAIAKEMGRDMKTPTPSPPEAALLLFR